MDIESGGVRGSFKQPVVKVLNKVSTLFGRIWWIEQGKIYVKTTRPPTTTFTYKKTFYDIDPGTTIEFVDGDLSITDTSGSSDIVFKIPRYSTLVLDVDGNSTTLSDDDGDGVVTYNTTTSTSTLVVELVNDQVYRDFYGGKLLSLVNVEISNQPIKYYYNEITITEQSGNDLTDYPIKITLDSSWDGWDIVSDDGSDIYFLDSSDNPLYYWIEKFDKTNQQTTIWVKIPSIPASSSINIKIHYGSNNPYSNYNDPEQVFLFFDDFKDDPLNSGWESDSDLTYSWDGDIVTIDMKKGLYRLLDFALNNGNYMIETRVRVNEIDDSYSGVFASPMSSPYTAGSNGNGDATVLYMTGTNTSDVYVWIGSGSSTSYDVASAESVGWSITTNTWYITGINVKTDGVDIYSEYSLYSSYSVTWSKDLTYIRLGYFSDTDTTTSSSSTSYDWIRIRKHVDSEPSVSISTRTVVTYSITEESPYYSSRTSIAWIYGFIESSKDTDDDLTDNTVELVFYYYKDDLVYTPLVYRENDFLIYIDSDGYLYYKFLDSDETIQLMSITSNTWYHLFIQRDTTNTSIILYHDGSSTSFSYTSTVSDTGTTIIIGYDGSMSGEFDLRIIRVYSRILTTTEMDGNVDHIYEPVLDDLVLWFDSNIHYSPVMELTENDVIDVKITTSGYANKVILVCSDTTIEVQNDSEIDKYGVVEKLVVDKDITSDGGLDYAKTLLNYYVSKNSIELLLPVVVYVEPYHKIYVSLSNLGIDNEYFVVGFSIDYKNEQTTITLSKIVEDLTGYLYRIEEIEKWV